MKEHKCALLVDTRSHLPKLLPDSSWHKKLKRKIQKLFLVSADHPEVFIYLKSSAAIEKESLKQVSN